MKKGVGKYTESGIEMNERREKTGPSQEGEEKPFLTILFSFFKDAPGDDEIAGENIGDNIGRNKSENEFFFETSPDE